MDRSRCSENMMSMTPVPSFGTQFYDYPCLQCNNPPPSSGFGSRPVTTGSPAIGPLPTVPRHSYCTTFLSYIFSGGPSLISVFE